MEQVLATWARCFLQVADQTSVFIRGAAMVYTFSLSTDTH